MGLFESKEDKEKRLAAEAKAKAEKLEQQAKEREAYEARKQAEKEAKQAKQLKEEKEKQLAHHINTLKNEYGLSNIFPESELAKVMIIQNDAIIDMLATIAIAQGAIAGTAANMSREMYQKSLAKIQLKEEFKK